MGRSTRLFEIIQRLRNAERPVTARHLAGELEVTERTVYRDIVALQAMRVPIEGAAGIGYVMRSGYNLPPLMFSPEEVEAVLIGLSLVSRTGDAGLKRASDTAASKVASVLPENVEPSPGDWSLLKEHTRRVLCRGDRDEPEAARTAIREEEKLFIRYRDPSGVESERTIWPIALIYYIESLVLVAWCELRADYRHFRLDRIRAWDRTGKGFSGQGRALRRRRKEQQHFE